MRLLEVDADGVPQLDPLNAEFDDAWLKDPRNPRWIAKPTVAYLWARTVPCKQCRATLSLLKTRWLCKKDRKRVLLTMAPNADRTGVVFGVQGGVPQNGGNAGPAAGARQAHRSGHHVPTRGATCPCCKDAIMTMEDIRLEGRAGRAGCGHDCGGCQWIEGQGIPMCRRTTSGRWRKWQRNGFRRSMRTSRSACRRNKPPREGAALRAHSQWTVTASIRGGSCSRIGSYWPLASSF